jgi:hypothetical protein
VVRLKKNDITTKCFEKIFFFNLTDLSAR